VTSRILIPTQDSEGKVVAAHFGRAPYFTVIDLDEHGNTIEIMIHPNTGEHSGGKGHAHDNVLQHQPQAIIVQGMGPRGIMNFQSKNIAVLRANSSSVEDLVRAYTQKQLDELTEGCAEAHHK